MLYREIIAVCSEIHTKHIKTPCGQNVEFLGAFKLHVRLSVCPHVSTRLLLDGFPWNLIFVTFIKSVDELHIWAALNSRSLYMDTHTRSDNYVMRLILF